MAAVAVSSMCSGVAHPGVPHFGSCNMTVSENEHASLYKEPNTYRRRGCVMWWYLKRGRLARYFPRMLLVLALAATAYRHGYRGGRAGGFSPSSAAGLSSFGMALFALACDDTAEPVVFLSPLSVAGALALAAAGASPGASESELLSVLGVDAHTQIPELSSALLSPSGVELNVANSIWAQKSLLLPEFIKVAKTVHHAVAAPLPKTYAPIKHG